MSERTIALLVAAGKSERMQADMPKPYLYIGQEALLKRTARQFITHPGIDGVRVVIRREHHPYYRKAVQGLNMFPPVIGGDTRQESVRRGLESIIHRQPERVLVHDIARPLASHALITRVLKALDDHEAVVPALAVTDTIKRVDEGRVGETIPRGGLYKIQTPQGFHYTPLLEAHRKFAGQNMTDDAAVIEQSGGHVVTVDGEIDNFKLTTPMDMERMQTLLSLNTETRTGIGYDVHQLKEHDTDTPVQRQDIKLCGVRIPFSHGLSGHSDADVGLHALVDAVLGAIGDGDIGMHFPPEDPRWQGADSERFLLHAYELVGARGGEIVHLDVTLICEKPKIAQYRQQMVQHIAQILKLMPDRVSVKATTTEKLGFTGRGEGIAAQAVATIRLPRK